jgi:sarcosine oxidase subunit gamma
MSEFRVKHRSALSDQQPIRRNGVSLDALPEGTVLHLLARASDADLSDLRSHMVAAGLSLRSVSPGQWFAVGTNLLAHTELQALAATLKPNVDIVDQSHGRVRILLKGPQAARVLSKGTAVDLDSTAFPVGHSTTTLIGHITAHLTRVETDGFELVVLRGFAESLWDELAIMSREFS